MNPITFTLLGSPVPWARAQGGRSTRLFTPAKQRNNAAALQMAAQEAMRPMENVPHQEMFTVPVRLDLWAEMEIPRSWSKRKQNAALVGEIKPGVRPDLSNIIKQLEDALNGVVYCDDALIVQISARKVYGLQPKLVVTVSAAGEQPQAAATPKSPRAADLVRRVDRARQSLTKRRIKAGMDLFR